MQGAFQGVKVDNNFTRGWNKFSGYRVNGRGEEQNMFPLAKPHNN